MYKPKSLSQHLTKAVPDLTRNPDKLHVFIDEGATQSTGTLSLSFRYDYVLNLIVTDFTASYDALFVPLLAWLKVHQSEIFDNPDLRAKAIKFEVDINNHESSDISIKLMLTESVVVKRMDGGMLNVEHVAEPQQTPPYADDFWTLYDGDSLLAQWYTPTPPA